MSIAQDNRTKYLKPPTYEEIETFRKELGVRIATFEKYFGLSVGCIKRIRKGREKLPAKAWNFIYEHIVPQYGLAVSEVNLKTDKLRSKKGSKPRKKKLSPAVMDKLSKLQ